MKNNKIATVVAIVSVILVFVLFVGLIGSLSDGFKNWDSSTWISRDEVEDPADVKFELVFDEEDADSGMKYATLTKAQSEALSKYSEEFFMAKRTYKDNDEDGEEITVTEDVMFSSFCVRSGEEVTCGYSDSGTLECGALVLVHLDENNGQFAGFDTTKFYCMDGTTKLTFSLKVEKTDVGFFQDIIDTLAPVEEEEDTSK